jgi:hypothetical protein
MPNACSADRVSALPRDVRGVSQVLERFARLNGTQPPSQPLADIKQGPAGAAGAPVQRLTLGAALRDWHILRRFVVLSYSWMVICMTYYVSTQHLRPCREAAICMFYPGLRPKAKGRSSHGCRLGPMWAALRRIPLPVLAILPASLVSHPTVLPIHTSMAHQGISFALGSLGGSLVVSFMVSSIAELPSYLFTGWAIDHWGRHNTMAGCVGGAGRWQPGRGGRDER